MWKGRNRKTKDIENCKNTTGNKVRSVCEEGSWEDKKGWKEEQKDSKQKGEKYFENCEKTTGNKVRSEYEEGSWEDQKTRKEEQINWKLLRRLG